MDPNTRATFTQPTLMPIERDWRLDFKELRRAHFGDGKVVNVMFRNSGDGEVVVVCGSLAALVAADRVLRAVGVVFGDARAVAVRVSGNLLEFVNGLSFVDKARLFNAL